jgi:hypothetical protein
MSQLSCQPCLPVCDSVFERVVTSLLVRGGSQIFYTLKPTFVDKPPYSFQLQVGGTASNDSDDWIDIGASVSDALVLVDGEQRDFSKLRKTFYRIKLVTHTGAVYYSDPTGTMGTMEHRWWRIARGRLRQELVAMRKGPGGQMGYLLKRRITGIPCPVCTDPLTNEVRNPACPVCFSTGFWCGYFYPIACVWASMSPRTYHTNLDPQRGTTCDVVVKAHMANTWMLDERDIWICKSSDDRYFIHSVKNTNEFRGVPISADVELRLAPATSPIYGIKIPDQLEALDYMRIQA